MRPYVAWALLITLVSQLSGTASASTGARPWQMSLANLLQPLQILVASAGFAQGPPRPLIRHTPLPLRPPADYASPKRHVAFLPPRPGSEIPLLVARPMDLVKLQLERRHFEHQPVLRAVAPERHLLRQSRSTGPLNNAATPTPPPASVTGIWPWWTYEERSIPGVGQAMVNVTNLNFLFEENDVDIPEGGIDLAFRRIYNSESGHNYNNDDGSGKSIFGNKWTNNLDAHIFFYGGSGNQVSVYTGDGARDDYDCSSFTQQGVVCSAITPGIHDILAPTDFNSSGLACQFQWTKKSGTTYMFYAPYSGCGTGQNQNDTGFQGRLLRIYARNWNFYIKLDYTWANGDESNIENVTQIVATHKPDNTQLTLGFQQLSGTNPPVTELSTVARPDQETLYYYYYNNGDLLELIKPGNNPMVPSSVPGHFLDNNPIASGNVPETYDVVQSGQLIEICSPWATILNIQAQGGTPSNGACVDFDYTNHQLNDWYTRGVLNPTPNDSVVSQPIQSGPSTSFIQWDDTAFFLNGGSSGCPNNGLFASMSDVYGHASEWCYDSSGRVTQTSKEVNSSSWLTTAETWDSNNNLVETEDARNYKTDMAYDAYGNTLEVSLPQEQILVNGSPTSIRPTSLYDYDSYNNVVDYCDPANNPTNSWNPNPPASPCKSASNTYAHFTFGSDPNEPNGCLTETQTPKGYATTISYPQSPGACGYGLPIEAQGQSMSQPGSPPTRQPTQTFTYYQDGELETYNPGNGTWTLNYSSDGMNRLLTRTDPDNITSYQCYNLDGSTLWTETANQHNLDNPVSCPTDTQLAAGQVTLPSFAVSYGYNADGAVVMETHHHNCTGSPCPADNNAPTNCFGTSVPAGATCKFYDGLDRLVEVKQPYSIKANGTSYNEAYTNPWITRYLYDLTGNQYQFNNSPSFSAYGNLFKTQELLPSGGWVQNVNVGQTQTANNQYVNIKATAYDALDRPTEKYSLVASPNNPGSDQLNTETLTWDTSPLDNNLGGQLGSDCNAVGQCQRFDYQPDGKEITFKSSDGSSPERNYLYDPDDRVASIASTLFNNAQTYVYDQDGRMTSATEPSGYTGTGGQSAYTSAATLTYEYYADGKQKYLDVSSGSSGVLNQNHLRSYSYRTDGIVQTDVINDSTVQHIKVAGPTTVTYTYTSAGRVTQRTEAGAAAPTPSPTASPSTWSYDVGNNNSTGFLQTQTTPGGTTISYSSYSAENELLSASASSGPCAGVSNAYSFRGELVQWSDCSGQFGQAMMGNGASLQLQAQTQWQTPTYTWDGNMGVMAAESGYCGGNQNGCVSTWSFDAAGRMTNEYVFQTGQPLYNLTRCYDAENHLTATVNGGTCTSSAATVLNWGPNGHPAVIAASSGGTNYYETLHWDGSQLLFATSSSGTLDDVKIDDTGDITPQDGGYDDLTFYDRGPGGIAMGCHNKYGSQFGGMADSWTRGFHAGTLWLGPCNTSPLVKLANMPYTIDWYGSSVGGTPYTTIGNGGVLGLPRTDGLADGLDTIQGVRTYNSNAGIWTTPDVFEGVAQDPASQKSYMWNGDNPVSFVDINGFLIDWQGNETQQEQEKQDYNDVITYFASIGDQEAVDALTNIETNPDFTVTLTETNTLSDSSDQYDYSAGHSTNGNKNAGTIYWNPHEAVAGYDGNKKDAISPAINLLHEAGHASDFASNPSRFLLDMSLPAGNYQNLEDKRVMTGIEADALQDIGLPPRQSHSEGWECQAASISGGCQ